MPERFVRFVNLLLNDTTYLLDESLSKLAQIHSTQAQMADREAWARQMPVSLSVCSELWIVTC